MKPHARKWKPTSTRCRVRVRPRPSVNSSTGSARATKVREISGFRRKPPEKAAFYWLYTSRDDTSRATSDMRCGIPLARIKNAHVVAITSLGIVWRFRVVGGSRSRVLLQDQAEHRGGHHGVRQRRVDLGARFRFDGRSIQA